MAIKFAAFSDAEPSQASLINRALNLPWELMHDSSGGAAGGSLGGGDGGSHAVGATVRTLPPGSPAHGSVIPSAAEARCLIESVMLIGSPVRV